MLLHHPLELRTPPQKIVSLVPSQTELLYHLRLTAQVAGITKFCIHPPEWRQSKIIVGGTKNLNLDKIKNIGPDLIIANKEENLKEPIETLAKDYPVWLTDVNNFSEALQMIADIGAITQCRSEAAALITTIRKNVNALLQKSKVVRTCYLIWKEPYMTAGGDTFISDMMRICGLENIFAHLTRYPTITPNDIKSKGCQLVLLSSEPYPFKEKHIAELQAQLPGVTILLTDGEMFSWYGSRLQYAPAYFNSLIDRITRELY